MADAPTTRLSLLLRMRDAKDHEAWHTFVELYAPLVFRFARRRGLQDADAADLTQEVLRSVAEAMKDGKYESARGSFRGWLHTVTRNAVYKFLRDRQRHPSGTGDTQQQARLEQIPAPREQEEWDGEYQKRLFAWACDEIRGEFREKTWHAPSMTRASRTAKSSPAHRSTWRLSRQTARRWIIAPIYLALAA